MICQNGLLENSNLPLDEIKKPLPKIQASLPGSPLHSVPQKTAFLTFPLNH